MALIDIPQYRSELAEIRKSLLAAGDALHIDHIREQLDELTEEMNQPEFWNDPDHSAKVNQKVSNLKGKLEHYEKLLSSADDIEVMLEMAEEEKDEDTVTEAVNELATLKEHTDALELETLMRGDYDDNDAVLSLHAGAGGTEAQDWTSMLYRMYTRYCEKMGFTVKVLDLLDGDEAGIKSVTFEVSGDHAYGYLRGEKGVHRLVRISPFDANARRHTSFASLDVAPMLVLFAIVMTFCILGCFLPSMPLLLICVPIFVPIAKVFGWDLIWFGVIITVLDNMASITPPFGISLFVMKEVAGVTLGTMYRSAVPFVIALCVCLLLIVLFPPLATYLPTLMNG